MRIQKIVFMGTPEFAVPTLEALYKQYPDSLHTIITREDMPQGRGKKLKESPIKTVAKTMAFQIKTPHRKTELTPIIDTIDPDLIVVIAYGMILGGALGNFIDRIRLGAVTDFFQFHFLFIPFDFPWKYYPAFNIADSGIICGVILLFFTLNTAGTPEETTPEENVS